MTIITDPRCTEYRAAGHPEKPVRVSRTVDLLKGQKSLDLSWAEPTAVTDAQLLRAHSAGHLDRLKVMQDFDGDTPFFPGIGDHARRGVGGALHALELARKGEPAFSLLRPPGHHATRNHPMGFCYLGSLAIAALEAKAAGVKRVALFDFDVHHGNGTEDIVAGVDGISFASVHQHPCYPGTGTADVGGNCFNFPVAPHTPRAEWRAAFTKALDRLKVSKPEVLGVSAGFDAYVRDPLAQGTLEKEDFHWLGQQVREFGVPAFSILEGGYSTDLPELVLHYLLGLADK
jgi:acetoin utilization deacetylase AcuC-like enzyme